MKFRKLWKLLTSKFLLVCFLLLIELAVLPTGIFLLSAYIPQIAPAISVIIIVVDVLVALCIINSDINAEYKIAWLVPVLLIPPIGSILYLTLRRRKTPRRKLKKLTDRLCFDPLYAHDLATMERFAEKGSFAKQCAEFVALQSFQPATDCISFEYFSFGEQYFARLTEELKKAQKYIFIEFFVIAPGKCWDTVLSILKERAENGVDVRVIYDDIGSMLKVPSDYAQQLEKQGIRCMCFNPFRPVLDVAQNNRTHRKIVVIDGETAFTGGVNHADEYINETHPFGKWKDTGILLRGRAVQNFTTLFLQLWSLRDGEENCEKYLSHSPAGDCLCLVFGDSPFDGNRNICEDLYLKIIYNAKKYVYINTPYLILDGEMKSALVTAARSGVDVRITVPNIPDKKYVFALTKAFYSQLVREGVKIYRYTPGFLHAKSIVSDGQHCIIGSSNMDFRSFYLHWECDAMFFDERVCKELYDDYLATCEESELITKDKIKDSLPRLIYRSLLRIFAPLM